MRDRLRSVLDVASIEGLVAISFNDVDGRTVALISVASLADPGDWAYLHAEPGKLYVPYGTETIPLLRRRTTASGGRRSGRTDPPQPMASAMAVATAVRSTGSSLAWRPDVVRPAQT